MGGPGYSGSLIREESLGDAPHGSGSASPDTPDRADQAFAERVRLRRPHRRLEDGQAHRRDRPFDTLGVNAVVVMDDKSMRLIADATIRNCWMVHSAVG